MPNPTPLTEASMASIALTETGCSSLPIAGADAWYVAATDPATSVMTDFRERSSVTVMAGASIDAALDHMKHTGVRCAFVTDEARANVIGLITAYDIMGVKPMQLMQAHDTPRGGITVRDLMQHVKDWRVAQMNDVILADVAAILRLFDANVRTHIPVIETPQSTPAQLRGLFSAAKVRRVLRR